MLEEASTLNIGCRAMLGDDLTGGVDFLPGHQYMQFLYRGDAAPLRRELALVPTDRTFHRLSGTDLFWQDEAMYFALGAREPHVVVLVLRAMMPAAADRLLSLATLPQSFPYPRCWPVDGWRRNGGAPSSCGLACESPRTAGRHHLPASESAVQSRGARGRGPRAGVFCGGASPVAQFPPARSVGPSTLPLLRAEPGRVPRHRCRPMAVECG